jgi:hypothetical protein
MAFTACLRGARFGWGSQPEAVHASRVVWDSIVVDKRLFRIDDHEHPWTVKFCHVASRNNAVRQSDVGFLCPRSHWREWITSCTVRFKTEDEARDWARSLLQKQSDWHRAVLKLDARV